MDFEERALATLDTAAPTEFPEIGHGGAMKLEMIDKSFVFSVLAVFAFYAPFSEVHASHRQSS
jgi:hypothetical protein